MVYPSVPCQPLCLQPLSLYKAACNTFERNTSWHDINELLLKREIPHTVYDDLWQSKKDRRDAINTHNWKVAGPLSTDTYLSLFDRSFCSDIEPSFYYENTLIKRRFVTMILQGQLGRNVYNFCPTCWNDYVRFNTDKMRHVMLKEPDFVYVESDLLVEGIDVLEHLRVPNNWCHRCYTTILCSIHESKQRYSHFWSEPEELLCHETVLHPIMQ